MVKVPPGPGQFLGTKPASGWCVIDFQPRRRKSWISKLWPVPKRSASGLGAVKLVDHVTEMKEIRLSVCVRLSGVPDRIRNIYEGVGPVYRVLLSCGCISYHGSDYEPLHTEMVCPYHGGDQCR